MDTTADENATPASAAPVRARRGSFIVRMTLGRVAPRQDPRALAAAARIVVVLPLVQTALLVGVLNAEPWQALLGLEGLVVAALAGSQLRRGALDARLVGYGIALLNAAALGAVGLALGGHLLWVSGLMAILPVTWLVFARNAGATVRRALLAAVVPLALLAGACGMARYCLVSAPGVEDANARAWRLAVCWHALDLRGGNGTERALLRLRQAQAAFAARDYPAAFAFAHDGAYDARGNSRVPATPIGQDLLDTLLRLKAQAFYNHAWQRDEGVRMSLAGDALPPQTLADPAVRVRWGW